MEYVGSVVVKASPERVMKALTDEKELPRWFPTTARTDPKPGGKWEFTWEFPADTGHGGTEGKVYRNSGEYMEVSGTKLIFSWQAGGQFSMSGAGKPYRTLVEFSLARKGDGTEVKLVHEGLQQGEFEDHKGGWDGMLQNLKSYLEGGPDQRGKFGQIVK